MENETPFLHHRIVHGLRIFRGPSFFAVMAMGYQRGPGWYRRRTVDQGGD